MNLFECHSIFSDIWIQIQISVECKMHSRFSSEVVLHFFWVVHYLVLNWLSMQCESTTPPVTQPCVCISMSVCAVHTTYQFIPRSVHFQASLDWTVELVVTEDLLADGLCIFTEGCGLDESLQHTNTQTHSDMCPQTQPTDLLESHRILNAVTFLHMVKHGQHSKWKYKAGLVKNWVNYQRMW